MVLELITPVISASYWSQFTCLRGTDLEHVFLENINHYWIPGWDRESIIPPNRPATGSSLMYRKIGFRRCKLFKNSCLFANSLVLLLEIAYFMFLEEKGGWMLERLDRSLPSRVYYGLVSVRVALCGVEYRIPPLNFLSGCRKRRLRK